MGQGIAAYRIEVSIESDGMLTIAGIPFAKGDKVEVIVLGQSKPEPTTSTLSLRGVSIRYDDPFGSVAAACADS